MNEDSEREMREQVEAFRRRMARTSAAYQQEIYRMAREATYEQQNTDRARPAARGLLDRLATRVLRRPGITSKPAEDPTIIEGEVIAASTGPAVEPNNI